MKIDRRKIEMLTSMKDERMWSTIKFFAGGAGIDLSRKKVSPRDIANIRAALGSLTDNDLNRINEILCIFKNGR